MRPDPTFEEMKPRVDAAYEAYNHACFDAAEWYEDWKKRTQAVRDKRHEDILSLGE